MQIEHSPEIEQLTQEAHDAWARGDANWLADHISTEDPIMLGSAPDEEMRGTEPIADGMGKTLAARESWGFKPTGPRIIDARQCGDIGWSVTEQKWEFEDGSYLPTRGLTIWHYEDSRWKLVVGLAAPAFSNDLVQAGSPVTQPAEAAVST
jgi:ketosteroid isomerase-like protein